MCNFDALIVASPVSYQQWIAEHRCDSLNIGVVSIYSRGSIPERNETNEMLEYLPGYLMIGDDSGDRAFVLKCERTSPVFSVDVGSLREQDLELVASSFEDWEKQGFAPPKQPGDDDVPLVADIYVDRVPDEDLKLLLAIKKLTAADWPASKLRQLLANQPFLAVRSGHPCALSKRLQSRPDLSGYLYYMADGILYRID